VNQSLLLMAQCRDVTDEIADDDSETRFRAYMPAEISQRKSTPGSSLDCTRVALGLSVRSERTLAHPASERKECSFSRGRTASIQIATK